MAVKEENLDDVISSLIDDDETSAGDVPGGESDAAPDVISDQPVSLTGRAAKQVELIRQNEKLDGDLFLRIAVEGGGCAGLNYKLGFDYRTDDDQEFSSEGVDIVVDPKHLIYLDGIVIDYPDGLDARGFTFNNPNASEACGCGSSFAV